MFGKLYQNVRNVLFCPDAAFEHAPKSRQFRKLAGKWVAQQTQKTAQNSNFVCVWSNSSFKSKTKRNRRRNSTPGRYSSKLSNPGAVKLGFTFALKYV